MDVSSARWLSESDMEEFEMKSLDYFNFQSFSSESYSSYQQGQDFNPKPTVAEAATIHTGMDRPLKVQQLKNNIWNSSTTTEQLVTPKASSSSFSQIISFGNQNSPPGAGNIDCCTVKQPKDEALNENYSPNSGQGTDKVGRIMSSRNPLLAQDHVLAERKRREKLSQRFIALSALIPGLKKMDKATVLGDAVKYLKHLQDRVKTLEEQTTNKVVESVVFVKKSRLSFESDHENSSSDENFECKTNQLLPEIEARVSEKSVLIRIHREKHKGNVAKMLGEIEKLHLTVTSSSVLPFGTQTMDITVVAQMNSGYCMTVKDLVKTLKNALSMSM